MKDYKWMVIGIVAACVAIIIFEIALVGWV